MIDDRWVESPLLGELWRALILRPDGLPVGDLPWLWLLTGRTDSADGVRSVLVAAGDAMASGRLTPHVVVVPDAPAAHRTSWWVDSAFVPHPEAISQVEPGRLLESSILTDVRPALEHQYGPPRGPEQRIIGGISMGGGAALRWLLVRPDLFGSAVLLSPAVFAALPVQGTPGRRRDVVDVEGDIFDTDRYERLLHYPTLLASVPPDRTRAHVVTVVGDQEPARSDHGNRRDLDLEAARLHAALKIHPAFESSLRVVGGRHELPVWERGLVTALQVLAGRDD